jgi:hypothetical protein
MSEYQFASKEARDKFLEEGRRFATDQKTYAELTRQQFSNEHPTSATVPSSNKGIDTVAALNSGRKS